MRHLISILTTILFTTFCCSAQELSYREVFDEYVFTRNSEIITMREMIRSQERGSELNRLFRSANRNKDWANVLALSGGIVLGQALSDALWNDDSDDSLNRWQSYVAGALLLGVTFPLSATADKRVRQAVDLYNLDPALGDASAPLRPPLRVMSE
ncbi:hypothetical protein GGR28_001526 [Lewinella aquimaris]|uniref:Uncharacterized protein n=1 Tax=Neolewinella aquimaris TaxID=1835722 RepID=A0A840EAS3_9BACT|nr:hypothetical protein [Neolewinella aquimaris]MBB4078909.1 hypothetical protein [Neolewinella aquimaris]